MYSKSRRSTNGRSTINSRIFLRVKFGRINKFYGLEKHRCNFLEVGKRRVQRRRMNLRHNGLRLRSEFREALLSNPVENLLLGCDSWILRFFIAFNTSELGVQPLSLNVRQVDCLLPCLFSIRLIQCHSDCIFVFISEIVIYSDRLLLGWLLTLYRFLLIDIDFDLLLLCICSLIQLRQQIGVVGFLSLF